jgi:two-component system, cell cycle sensor histidine kinase and response regulator CckA
MTEPTPRPSQAELDRLRLVAVVESSDDAIVSKDLDGTIRTWNRAAERIFGYTAAEMVGDSIFRLIPPDLHDEEHGLLARIRAGEHISHYETTRVRKDGRRILVSLTLSPLFDGKGRLIGASAIKRDVTSQRAMENQLEQARRMEAVGRLAGGIAHDFNNLLTVIGGLSIMTLQELEEGSAGRHNLRQVIMAADRATALTQQLLTFSRRQMAEVKALDMNEVVTGLESLLRRLIGEHITLQISKAPDLGRVRGNEIQLEQVLMNLVLNARDAMPEGGTLAVATRNVEVTDILGREQLRLTPGPYVMLSVSDTGAGMDAVTQASIFEPFFTTKAPGEGTGLGLATVYAIVQQAGGAIYVYSEPGLGSTFKVYFPRIDVAVELTAAVDTPLSSGPEGTGTGLVVVTEDEPGVRSFAAQVLQQAGYRVLEAGSGPEALELAGAQRDPVTLLLTDVVMPGMTGRVLAERMRALYPGIAVLYMSGYTDDMVVRVGVAADGRNFLQKPFTPESLLARVRSVLAPLSLHGRH